MIGQSRDNCAGYGIYGPGSDSLIENNTFADNGGYGIHHSAEEYPTAGCGLDRTVIRNNVFHGNGFGSHNINGDFFTTPAVIIAHGCDAQFYNNVLYGNNSGLQVWSTRTLIYNNTFYGNDGAYGSGCLIQGPWGSDNSGTVFKNNICYGNQTNSIDIQKGTVSQSNNLLSDPNFVNPSAGDFHITSNSPAKDAGISLPEVPCDFDGNGRPAGSAYDVGAYEQGGTPGSGCSKGGGGGGGGGPRPTLLPNQPPVVSISAIPSSISIPGQGMVLQWYVTNATSCTASGSWSGSQATGGTLYLHPSATSIYTLTCTGPGGTGQGSATVTVGGSTSCTQYSAGSSMPSGFGVPWDVTSPSTLLLSAACTPPTVLVKVGNPNTASVSYVYKTAYTAPSGAQGWTPVNLFGSQLISGSWYKSFECDQNLWGLVGSGLWEKT